MAPRTRLLVAATALVAAAATTVVSAVPAFAFAWRSPLTHVAIETAASLVAIVAAYLMLGRFRASRSLLDLTLLVALAILGTTNLAFSTALSLAELDDGRFAVWAPLTARVLAAAVLAYAAFAPARRVAAGRRAPLAAAAAVVGSLALAGLVGALGSGLEAGVDPDLSPESTNRPRIVGGTLLLGSQVVGMALYVLAAAGFARRAERSGDDLLAWFAIGSTLAAFSRLNYFLFPSIFSNYVYTGDVLRLLFYVALLTGTLRALAVYQREAAEAAVARERQRMARDLHDGVAQELAFISMTSRRIAGHGDGRVADQIAAAAERALDESRSAISALSRDGDRALWEEVAEAVETVAARAGARAWLDLDETLVVAPDVRVALVRVVREAAANATRHGGARELRVRLGEDASALVLEVADDGSGFDPERVTASPGGGFGLRGMRERAASIGGELTVDSRPGGGTRIELRVPRRRSAS